MDIKPKDYPLPWMIPRNNAFLECYKDIENFIERDRDAPVTIGMVIDYARNRGHSQEEIYHAMIKIRENYDVVHSGDQALILP
jgi:hypothetical protein